jgi:hypothetical protein
VEVDKLIDEGMSWARRREALAHRLADGAAREHGFRQTDVRVSWIGGAQLGASNLLVALGAAVFAGERAE